MATAKKKAPVKKTVAKKTTKKVAVTKTAKKTATKKTVAKKTVAKKTTSKKAKAPVKKTVANKVSVKGTPKVAEKKPAKKLVLKKPQAPAPIKFEKPNLSDKTLARLKELLIAERARHLHQSEDLAQEAVELITDREAGDTQFDEESGEGDSIAVERERSLFLSAEARNTVNLIDKALENMKNKSYGLCMKCGKRIAVARLEALPWADICIDCKAKSERRY